VTTTQEELITIPSSDGDGGATRGRRRTADGLAGMLLPELKSLAGTLGISASGMRKGDLVAAIESARVPAARAPRARAAAATAPPAAAPVAAPVEAPAAEAATRPTRARRSASRASGAPAGEALDSVTGSANEAAAPAIRDGERTNDSRSETRTSDSTTNGAARTNDAPRTNEGRPAREPRENREPREGREPRENREPRQSQDRGQDRSSQDRSSQDRSSQDRGPDRPAQDRSNHSNNDRGSQDRSSQDRGPDRPVQDRSSQDRYSESGGQGSGANSYNQGVNNGGPSRDDEEYDPTRRRGRRYRDRRGRTRDGRDAGPTRPGMQINDGPEPTVSDDDIVVPVAGILDAIEDKNTWFIRTGGYFASSDDVYVANSFIRRFNLRRGDAVTGAIKQSRDGERREKFNPLVRLDTVNGLDPEAVRNRPEFTKLTPLYPQERLRLETEPHILTTRVIDLVMPLGKGQRALIVSPPKAGKTSVLQALANAITTNNPECHLMVVLVDERPEEVTDMQRSVKGEVIASTFDRRPQDHTMIAELSIERAKRLVEMGQDVVVLLDSITRLGRAYNLAAPASGRILSGGVDSTALYPPKRFLGAARNIENGGSLTIIATALVETGSTMDTVIFEEFKGTGNAELKLDRKIADKRVFPAVDVDQSGTRKEEILLPPDELAVVIKLRRVLHSLDSQQAIDLLLDRLKKSRTNLEFLMQIAKTTPGQD
jgi:transcription termination factor Rho